MVFTAPATCMGINHSGIPNGPLALGTSSFSLGMWAVSFWLYSELKAFWGREFNLRYFFR